MRTHEEAVKLIWDIAELLRGPYRPPQYERVMLPMTVLRRFDCVLESTKDAVVAEYERLSAAGRDEATIDRLLQKTSKYRFHNHSKFNFEKLLGDSENLAQHLENYIQGFSSNVRKIFDYFEFRSEVARMSESDILFLVVRRFSEVDLHPDVVDNVRMGQLFEELIRRFNEQANETAGDYFTPREVIRLMVDLLLRNDDAALTVPGTVRTLLDPACGTGGMLSEAQAWLRKYHKPTQLFVYGQDFNPRAYAIAASDLLMKDEPGKPSRSRVEYGDSFLDDKYEDDRLEEGTAIPSKFDYFLANPPFGVDWKRQEKEIKRQSERLGFGGRFGAGVPRVSDGALLFLQHMWSKRQDTNELGSRLAIVFNGSPLFSGGAESGESNIRRWIIQNDWLEAIVALPEQMFYNTGIATYIWILSNRKTPERKGKIQLIDARERWVSMRKSLGQKRRKLGEGKKINELTGEVESNDPRDDIADIVKEYGDLAEGSTSKILDNDDFGYTRVTVERPLRLRYQMTLEGKARMLAVALHLSEDVEAIDEALGREPLIDWSEVSRRAAQVCKTRWKQPEVKLFRDIFTERDPEAKPVIKSDEKKIIYEADPELRDFENIPLKVDINEFFKTEVKPHVPDAWMDRTKDKTGYEINFNRLFYVYTPPRPLKEIDIELRELEKSIVSGLREILESKFGTK
ncbi:MAG TPA: class I SAM-dependent DNA methyltransferase [Fimbriimonadaceae bacterium]